MTLQFSEPISVTNTSDSPHQNAVAQPHLAAQDASTVDPSKLTALSPEVVSALILSAIYNIYIVKGIPI